MDNGVDLMLYQMRREDGTADPFSSGSLIDAAGQVTHLASGDFRLTPLDYWTSAATSAKYPLQWSIQLPRHGYRLTVKPAFASQEMTTRRTTGIDYWEGAIEIEGSCATQPVAGRGYMELTGYTGLGLGSLISD
jgi:predicted secreted hydrolase